MDRTSYSLLGQNGGVLVDDTNEHNAETESGNSGAFYCAIQALTAATLDESGMADYDTETNIKDLDVDLSLAAGTVIYGRFATVQLTTGTVIAYFG